MKISLALVLMVLCRASLSSFSDAFITEKSKLIDKQGAMHYFFGSYGDEREIALNDDIIVIGSAGDHGTNGSLRYQGSASLFRRQEGNVPALQRKIRPPNSYLDMANLYYGSVVDANKNFVVVGAFNQIQSVFIYRAQYPFKLVTRIQRNDLSDFGHGLSISVDNTLVIGAPRSNGQDRGTACIYGYKMNEQGYDTWALEHTLKPTDLQDNIMFGHRIASSRDHIVVVAPGDYSAQDRTVYVYRKNGDGSWNLKPQKMTSPGYETNSLFGSAVAVDEKRLVIGARALDKVFVYELSRSQPDIWVLNYTLTSKYTIEEGVQIKSSFGSSVALKGEAIAVGASTALIVNVLPKRIVGACFLFKYDSVTGKWRETAPFRASDMHHDDYFGTSVAMDEKEVFVGSKNMARGMMPGAVYVFDAKPSSADKLKLSKWSVTSTTVLGLLIMCTTGERAMLI